MKLVALLLVIFSASAQAELSMNQSPPPGAYVNENGGPLLPLLQNARQKIDIEVYTMNDPSVRALLRDALRRGVKVRILKDPNPLGVKCNIFGSMDTDGFDSGNSKTPSDADCADQQKLVSDVRAAGGEYLPFNKRALCPNGGGSKGDGCFEHGKIVIADDLALISSGNFDTTNLCIESERPKTCDRDYSLIVNEADVVTTLKRIFEADLAGSRYDVSSLIPSSLQGLLTVSPISKAPILAFIDSAQSTLEVETQYLKDPEMNAHLIQAAHHGVKVSVITASACAFGHPSQSESREISNVYSSFDAAGISSRMFTANTRVNGHDGYLHAKAIVVDGAKAWVGSVNGSTESLTENREYGLIFDRGDDVQTVRNQIQSDVSNSGDESWQESLSCSRDKANSLP